LPDNSKCIGKTVEEITLPDDTSLAAIVRDGRVFNPKPHDTFAAGDEIIFVASNVAEATLKACFIA
jgi:trk system potassium uptake protein TrkA